jgi:hypothetical protein
MPAKRTRHNDDEDESDDSGCDDEGVFVTKTYVVITFAGGFVICSPSQSVAPARRRAHDSGVPVETLSCPFGCSGAFRGERGLAMHKHAKHKDGAGPSGLNAKKGSFIKFV